MWSRARAHAGFVAHRAGPDDGHLLTRFVCSRAVSSIFGQCLLNVVATSSASLPLAMASPRNADHSILQATRSSPLNIANRTVGLGLLELADGSGERETGNSPCAANSYYSDSSSRSPDLASGFSASWPPFNPPNCDIPPPPPAELVSPAPRRSKQLALGQAAPVVAVRGAWHDHNKVPFRALK